jgi:hypothetical protein
VTVTNASDARVAANAAPIGGFFERHQPDGRGASVLERWTEGRPHAAFVNARSAFAALAAAFPQATVWLPAFLCADLVQPAYARRTRFYPVKDGFEPDLDLLEAEAKAGDLVLVTAYFGLPVGDGARRVLTRRPDLHVVEDRAQALDPGPGVPGAWRLYSPRKLLGVADGGLLIAPDDASALPQPTEQADSAALWAAPLLRTEDPPGRNNAQWHGANQAKEAAMAVGSQAMTDLSLSILAQTSLASLAAPRLRNWRVLDAHLRSWSALPADPASPPLGYVLRLAPDLRDKLLSGLHAERIFAAAHWPRIAGPAEDFPREAGWSRRLITLPCDHRYDEAAMARIAGRVVDLLG